MSKTYKFLAKWTRIDEFRAPYNAAIFEKLAASYGRTLMAFIAAVGSVMVCGGIALTGAIVANGLQRAYLAAAGIETQADVLSIVLDPPRGSRPPQTATLNYTFNARNGESIQDSLRRAPWEFAGIEPGKPIDLLYADQWPRINLPRIGFKDSVLRAFMGLLSLAVTTHLIFFLMRYVAWRGRAISAPQPARE